MKPDRQSQEPAFEEGEEGLDQFADRVASMMAPLRHMDQASEMRKRRLRFRLHHLHSLQRSRAGFSCRPAYGYRHARALLFVAVCCAMLVIGVHSVGGLAAIERGASGIWHASTSLDQLQGISVTALSRPRAGVEPLPLLPTTLPGDAQASNYGVITDAANPNALSVFVADFRIAGQDVLLYEQPSDVIFSSSSAQAVRIGGMAGQLFQDSAGNLALQWFQHGMFCQITSRLPVSRLVSLASTFEPIKSWDLLM